MKDVIILGGPNGARKTTAAPSLLTRHLGIREFVNADEIARGLSPFNPEGSAVGAARLMIRRIRELSQAGESFSFETTCAGRRYAAGLRNMRHLYLPLVDIALVYDNSDNGHVLIAEKTPETDVRVYDPKRWTLIEEATR